MIICAFTLWEKHIYIVKCQRYICIDLDLCDDRHRNGLLSDAATVPRVFFLSPDGRRAAAWPFSEIHQTYIYILLLLLVLLLYILHIYIHLKPYKNVGSYLFYHNVCWHFVGHQTIYYMKRTIGVTGACSSSEGPNWASLRLRCHNVLCFSAVLFAGPWRSSQDFSGIGIRSN